MLRRYSKAAGKGFRVVWKKGTRFLAYPTMTHKKLEELALAYFSVLPDTFAFPTHGRRYPELKGAADLIVCQVGIFSAVEFKLGKDRQRPEQREFELNVHRASGHYHVVGSFEELQQIYDRYRRGVWHSQPEPRRSSDSSRKAPSAGASTPTGTTPAKPRASRRRSPGSPSASGSPGGPSA